MGILQKLGTSAGAVVDTVIIGPVTIVDNLAEIFDFSAEQEDAGTDADIRLQVSRDLFVADIRTIGRLIMPVGGSHIRSYSISKKVQPGESFRVIFKQVVNASISVELDGTTNNADIIDP